MPTISSTHICASCRRSFTGSGSLCPQCRPKDNRKPAFKRGYDHTWRKVRSAVLTEYNIPKELWPLYDVDHNPPYDPRIEADHTKYELIPRLHAEHSRKTATEDVRRYQNGQIRSNS